MPRYAETIDDFECYDLVIWQGTLYGVLYSDREFAGLIPIDKLRTHQGDDQKLYGFAVLCCSVFFIYQIMTGSVPEKGAST